MYKFYYLIFIGLTFIHFCIEIPLSHGVDGISTSATVTVKMTPSPAPKDINQQSIEQPVSSGMTGILNEINSSIFYYMEIIILISAIVILIITLFFYRDELESIFLRIFSHRSNHSTKSCTLGTIANLPQPSKISQFHDDIEELRKYVDKAIAMQEEKLSSCFFSDIDNLRNKINDFKKEIYDFKFGINEEFKREQKRIREQISDLEKNYHKFVSSVNEKTIKIDKNIADITEFENTIIKQFDTIQDRLMKSEQVLNLTATSFSISRLEQYQEFLSEGQDILQSYPALSECGDTIKKLASFFNLHQLIPGKKDVYLKDIKTEIYDAFKLRDSKSVFIFKLATISLEHEELNKSVDNILNSFTKYKTGKADMLAPLALGEQFVSLSDRMIDYRNDMSSIKRYINKNKQSVSLQTEDITELFTSSRTSLLTKLRERLPKLREINTQPELLELFDKSLNEAGIQRILITEGDTFLNDTLHIAIDYEENTGLEPKTIVSVIRDGFIVDDTIWERADVITAR